jgi:hypothetical protein
MVIASLYPWHCYRKLCVCKYHCGQQSDIYADSYADTCAHAIGDFSRGIQSDGSPFNQCDADSISATDRGVSNTNACTCEYR